MILSMKLHLLGVNGPFPESCGATSGYLLESGNDLIQFDLGSGVLSPLFFSHTGIMIIPLIFQF